MVLCSLLNEDFFEIMYACCLFALCVITCIAICIAICTTWVRCGDYMNRDIGIDEIDTK